MKQLQLTGLNAKDAKDHLPMDPAAEAQALSDYAAAGIHLHAAGTVYFPKDEDEDIRSKFEYAKRAGIQVIVAGDPAPPPSRASKNSSRNTTSASPSTTTAPKTRSIIRLLTFSRWSGMDPRIGCCIDVGHCVRAGADVVESIHTAGPRLSTCT